MVSGTQHPLELIRLRAKPVRFASPVAAIGEHDALFAEPFVLWGGAPDRLGGPSTKAPALISYHADDFMERLARDVAPDAGPLDTIHDLREVRLGTEPTLAKFFQPIHGWFHLVACSFACRIPGYPDRAVSADQQESLSFVIRRVRPRDGVKVEEAWVPGSKGPDSADGGWVAAGTPAAPRPVEGEERFALARCKASGERLLCTGYLPVTSRASYLAQADDPWSSVADARLDFSRLRTTLRKLQAEDGRLAAARLLVTVYDYVATVLPRVKDFLAMPDSAPPDGITIQELALASWLREDGNFSPLRGSWTDALAAANLQRVAIAAAAGDPGPVDYDLTRVAEAKFDALIALLVAAIEATYLPWGDALLGWNQLPAVKETVATILARRRLLSTQYLKSLNAFIALYLPEVATAILSPIIADDTESVVDPHGRFAQVDSSLKRIVAEPGGGHSLYAVLRRVAKLAGTEADPHDITDMNAAEFAAMGPQIEAALAGAILPKYPAAADVRDLYFIVRCVYERGCCQPARVLFSDASARWVPAPVFDPEAPARQMRVPLPVSIDPKDLGKPKGLGFMMSNELRKQMGRIKPTMLAGAPAGQAPQIDVGAICSFSIPIVTICALILLIIMVNILNTIFRWLPYFVVCYPLKLSKPSTPS